MTNTAWSIVRGQNGTIIYIRAVQGHSHRARINPNFLFSLKDTAEFERTHISTRTALPTVNQSYRMVHWQED